MILLLSLILVSSIVSGRLILDRDIIHKNKDSNNIGGDWPINQTVTFISNISSLIPQNCYFPAENWIVRSGYAMAQPNGTSSFGYIFYGA